MDDLPRSGMSVNIDMADARSRSENRSLMDPPQSATGALLERPAVAAGVRESVKGGRVGGAHTQKSEYEKAGCVWRECAAQIESYTDEVSDVENLEWLSMNRV